MLGKSLDVVRNLCENCKDMFFASLPKQLSTLAASIMLATLFCLVAQTLMEAFQ